MQFDVNKWLRENMVEAVNKGYMSLPCISVKAGDYYKAGMFTAEDVEYIATNAKEPVAEVIEENTPPVVEPPMEIPTEEITEPATENIEPPLKEAEQTEEAPLENEKNIK